MSRRNNPAGIRGSASYSISPFRGHRRLYPRIFRYARHPSTSALR
jgi:hypothetical protein